MGVLISDLLLQDVTKVTFTFYLNDNINQDAQTPTALCVNVLCGASHDSLLQLQAQAEAFFIGGLEHLDRRLWVKMTNIITR